MISIQNNSNAASMLPKNQRHSSLPSFAEFTESIKDKSSSRRNVPHYRFRHINFRRTATASSTSSSSGSSGSSSTRRRRSDSSAPRRICRHPGCEKCMRAGGYCFAHGGGRKCSFNGCNRSVQNLGRCFTHGGKIRCQAPKCKKIPKVDGYCHLHYDVYRYTHIRNTTASKTSQ